MVTVKRVESKADRRRFVDFPNQLYKDNPNFVPATYGDDLSDWDPKANPAFSLPEWGNRWPHRRHPQPPGQ